MVPGQLWIQDNRSGTPLAELWRDRRYILLLFSGPDPSPKAYQHLKEIAAAVQKEYSRQLVACLVVPDTGPAGTNEPGYRQVADPGNRYLRLFGEDQPCLYLIRPDGFIAYHSNQLQSGKLLDYLQSQFRAVPVPEVAAQPVPVINGKLLVNNK
jgi:hypothetical protein